MSKEQDIIQAAEAEFFQNGYSATSMVTVSKRAGVTHAMVNYYFRTKEQLFITILDRHFYALLEKVKAVMDEEKDFLQNVLDGADALFMALNQDRNFPFLLCDVVRTDPELLERYRATVEKVSCENFLNHTHRLMSKIQAGLVEETTMGELFDNVFTLVVSPFLTIPVLRNVQRLDDEGIERYLVKRRAEIQILIRKRYTA